MAGDTRQKSEQVCALRNEVAALLDLHDDQIINATLAHLIAAQLSRYDEKDRKRLRIGIFGLSRRLIPRYEQARADIQAAAVEFEDAGHRSRTEAQRNTGAPVPTNCGAGEAPRNREQKWAQYLSANFLLCRDCDLSSHS